MKTAIVPECRLSIPSFVLWMTTWIATLVGGLPSSSSKAAAQTPNRSERAEIASPSPIVISIDQQIHHLRSLDDREWDSFPARAEGSSLRYSVQLPESERNWTLLIRQIDVKQRWRVLWDDVPIGELIQDENDLVVAFEIRSEQAIDQVGELTIEPVANQPLSDDIRIGEIEMVASPKSELLSQATLVVSVADEETHATPSRITITDERGVLVPVGSAEPATQTAVRSGTVYTIAPSTTVSLPVGTYRVWAGRGFEYSLDSTEVTVDSETATEIVLTLKREVDTTGYIACDPHIHSLTHSGHGDATVLERMVTLAAEGIELPIATDHNVFVDHRAFVDEVGVAKYLTPVIGNEVTTGVGHFDIFPVAAGSDLPDHRLMHWEPLFASIRESTRAPIIILNHARDLHSGVRPFGPRHFNEVVGENQDGWPMDFNAMEIINSSATQSDPLQLTRDWMTLLNRGLKVTPVGSSDSHDVLRHFVGQGRTYIRCNDANPGAIEIEDAVAAFLAGQVRVSYGLLVELHAAGKSSGETITVEDAAVEVTVTVRAPSWIKAERVELFVNGQSFAQLSIDEFERSTESGSVWRRNFTFTELTHDINLVAVATGPGIDAPHWRTAKPYQPTSTAWEPIVLGVSGALWLDVDGDGIQSASDYAERLWSESSNDLNALLNATAAYDSVTASHVAHRIANENGRWTNQELERSVGQAADHVQEGFARYRRAAEAVARARVEERE